MSNEDAGRASDLNPNPDWQVIWRRGGREEATPAARRKRMVEEQLRGREITSQSVLWALGKVPRHLFVRPEDEASAYEDRPLLIGEGQTISQPYMVALMTQLLHLRSHHRVLEIGTGSGYQAAILAELVAEVYSVELSERLATTARRRLTNLGYANVHVRCGDGHAGWPEHAPFDAIVVTCAAERLPEALTQQLAEGGRLVIPIGPRWSYQLLWLMERRGERIESAQLGKVSFVPFRRPNEG